MVFIFTDQSKLFKPAQTWNLNTGIGDEVNHMMQFSIVFFEIAANTGLVTSAVWFGYQRHYPVASKFRENNTVRYCQTIIVRFIQKFGDGPVEQATPEQILTYLNRLTEGNKPYTKRIRYSQFSSFFNFVRNNIDPELRNPCDRPMIRKL